MASSSNETVTIFNSIITSLYQYVSIPLYIIGNLGNLLSAWIFFKKTWRKNVCVFYFQVCIFFDLLHINTSILGTILNTGFNINLQNSNVILCKLYNYLSFFFSTTSITILALASIDRLLISSQNIETRLYSSKRLAYFLISISTTFWFIFFFHVLIKFDRLQVAPFVYVCIFDIAGWYYYFFSYSLLIINLSLFVIMIILSILSFKNVRHIRSIPRKQRQTVRTMRKKDFQLLRCLFARDVSHILGSTFLIIYTIYQGASKIQRQTPWEQAVDRFIFNLAHLFPEIPVCISFFIYLIGSKAFRQEIKCLIWKILGKDLVIIRGEEEQNDQQTKNINVEMISHISNRA